MKDKRHADMVNKVVNILRNNTNNILEVEQPYNYFGDRGVIDLAWALPWSGCWCIRLIEFKTEIVDLGETIRQIKKASKYYPLSNNTVNGVIIPSDNLVVQNVLVIADTEQNINKIIEYKNMLASINNFTCSVLVDDNRHLFSDKATKLGCPPLYSILHDEPYCRQVAGSIDSYLNERLNRLKQYPILQILNPLV